jgi:uncharacterized Rossmann fold enzyme
VELHINWQFQSYIASRIRFLRVLNNPYGFADGDRFLYAVFEWQLFTPLTEDFL